MSKNILVVEDDDILNQLITRCLRGAGFDVTGVRRWAEADRYLEKREPHLIITDVRLPDGDNLSRLPQLSEHQPVIVLTGFGSVRDAVESMKAGAFEYLVKPISPEELLIVVDRALDTASLRSDHQFCRQRLQAQEDATSFMIGESAALAEVKGLIEAVAPIDMTVLIQGESGAGKELVARAIHQSGPRSQRNFVAVDCCTLQEKLFESELFGHEKGAFTGADRQKKGLIEGAEGGTLFLDEIGEIEPAIQAKLLRVLETGKFRRLGGTRDLDAHVRVVAATNRDLADLARTGGFRADLYYRLSAFTITTPPLRDRREDIPHLVEHFIHNHNFSRRIAKSVAPEALRKLVAYDWPGNVRELKNVIERAIILSRDKPVIGPEHLGIGPPRGVPEAAPAVAFDQDLSLDDLQGRYLAHQLQKHGGRRSKVAEVTGISERNLYRLIKRYGLTEIG
jgi:DNA-binding NtrC family response regulator